MPDFSRDPDLLPKKPEPNHANEALTSAALRRSPEEVVALLFPNPSSIPIAEELAAMHARRSLVKALESQDPRLFSAVLNLSRQIEEETTDTLNKMDSTRADKLSAVLRASKELTKQIESDLRYEFDAEVPSPSTQRGAEQKRFSRVTLSLKLSAFLSDLAGLAARARR